MNNQDAGWRGKFAGFSLALSLFAAAFFAIAALGSKFGLWGWQFGLGTMTFNWGPKLVMAGLAVSVLALIIALVKAPRKRAAILAGAALLISGLSMGRLAAAKGQAERLPPIHDIQTNWDAPIQPSAKLIAAREADGALNPVVDAPVVPDAANGRWPGMGGKLFSELQEQAEFDPETQKSPKLAPYPKLDTLELGIGPDGAFAATLAAVRAAGMEVVTEDRDGLSIEATATTGWFGFKDDVMVRLTPNADMTATLVDVRSTSRVGLSDLGANAKRVRDLLDDIERKAQTVG